MKKIWRIISENAYIVMLIGMIIGITGLLILMRFNHTGGPREIAIFIGIFGIVLYLTGRVALIFKGKVRKESDSTDQL